MFLEQLNLQHFRNYIQEEIKFTNNKIILLGDNAQGKSNILESVELLSTLKSHRSTKDLELVYKDRFFGQIKATVQTKYADYDLSITIPTKGKKELKINQEKVKRNFDFLGLINTVLFSSLDIDLVRGAPEYRRNWVDNLLIQLEPIYYQLIKNYYHILKQRNALLKQIKKMGINTAEHLQQDLRAIELELWDKKLAEAGSRISRRRARVLNKIEPLAKFWHNQISNKTEKLIIRYAPNIYSENDSPESVQNAIKAEIEQKKTAEINLGNTLVGPHRDEIEFIINSDIARNYGSQGQQRTLVLALKLAELQLIEQIVGEPPLLLLDDVMAELDLNRQRQLLDSLGDRFQTIITTTHLNYFETNLLNQAQIIKVQGGKLYF
ncbi:DNA replication/repair protein RecF [Cyanobacterium stanieri LEGE 03274]|uniref:DNA replication and repair protein RecF n=1 Tax=Cyanobacterium stanieri LEGE 03274 TaxID=1828756 RepID=A0ABR9V1N6_9CHRO|nr:DNA replication/repair protein RecF [Cyanobacterium stanieri]MBE9221795.1 DNA replication/repair protein RecF [Cyanobacterium stanieri LEGE 03274]